MLVRLSLSAAALIASLGVAMAQQGPPAQGNDQFKPQQNGKEEPGSGSNPQAQQNSDVFVNGKLTVPGAPEDSQTVPAKFSERNAKLDELPTMAFPLALTDEQKQRIIQSVGKSGAPVQQAIEAKPSDILAVTTPVSNMPDDVKAEVPIAGDLQFIRLPDKILLMRAPNMVVTGEIATR